MDIGTSTGRKVKKIRVSEKLYADVIKYVMEKHGVVSRHICKVIDEALKEYLTKRMNNPQIPSGFISRHYIHRFGKFVEITTTLSKEVEAMLEEYIKELSKSHNVNYGLRRAIVEEALTEYIKGGGG